ncbi:MAG: hypothetical protein EHM42_12110, partial [Planctomycetaceae bacterium]
MSATRRYPRVGLLAVLVCGSLWAGVGFAVGAITPEQKKQIEEITKELKKVPGLVTRKEVDDAEKLLSDSEQKLEAIGKEAGEGDNKQIKALLRQIEQLRSKLSKRT